MNERERINNLMTTGNITEDEAEILLAALAESQDETSASSWDKAEPLPPLPPVAPMPAFAPNKEKAGKQKRAQHETEASQGACAEDAMRQQSNKGETFVAQIEVMEAVIEAREEEIASCEKDIASLEEESVASASRIKECKERIERLEGLQEGSEESDLEINERHTELEKLEEEVAQAEIQQAEKEAHIQAKKDDIQKAKQDIAATVKVLADLTGETLTPEMESFTTEEHQIYVYRTGGENQSKEEAAAARARIINAIAAQNITQASLEAEHESLSDAVAGDKAAHKAAHKAAKAAKREAKKANGKAKKFKRKPAIVATENPALNSTIHRFISGLVHGGAKHTYIPTEDDAVAENWLKLSGFCGDLSVRCNPAIAVPRVEGNAILTRSEAGGYLIKTPSSSGGGWLKNLHKVASDIVVEVPEHSALELNMTAGDAKISGVESLLGSFVGGDFEAQEITGLDLLITAGDISLSTRLKEGEHKLAVVAGDVNLDFLQGSAVQLEATGRGGDINLKTAATMQEQSGFNFKKDFSCMLGEASETPATLHFNFTAGDITIRDDIPTKEVN